MRQRVPFAHRLCSLSMVGAAGCLLRVQTCHCVRSTSARRCRTVQVRAPVETQAAPRRSSLSSVSSVRTSELRLQSKNVSDGSTEWHAFSAGTVTQPSHTVLAFVPTVADLNAIKAKQQLAISAESSFFVISPALVSDMNGNAVVAIGNSSMTTVRRF